MTKDWSRPNTWLGIVVPLLLLGLIILSFKACVVDYGVAHVLLGLQRQVEATLYLLGYFTTLALAFYFYFKVYLFSHAKIGSIDNEDDLYRAITLHGPLQCRDDPSSDFTSHPSSDFTSLAKLLRRCERDGCRGRWKSNRARHCGDCQRCIPSMDHHCPWMNNCVSTLSLAPFIQFLFWTSFFLIWIWIWPLRTCLGHLRLFWTMIRSSDDSTWYFQWYSYALGPFIPTLFQVWHVSQSDMDTWAGYREYLIHGQASQNAMSLKSIYLLLLFLPPIFCSVTLTMLWVSANPDEQLRHFVSTWSPQGSKGQIEVTSVQGNPYDLGRKRNWQLVMGTSLTQWLGLAGIEAIDPLWPPMNDLVRKSR